MKTTSENSPCTEADHRLSPPPLPKPVLPIEYFSPLGARAPEPWIVIARFDSPAQWHQAKALLGRSQIESLMGHGEDMPGSHQSVVCGDGIGLAVRQSEAQRAQTILRECRSGKRFCPRCGSDDLQERPLPWYWVIWSIVFLGIAPFAPARWCCRQCGEKIQ